MADPLVPVSGMVDHLPGNGGPTEDALAFARAYLAEGEMDPALTARLRDPERLAERERLAVIQRANDWANLGYYRDDNERLGGQPVDVVFMGDSITEMWRVAQPELFTGGMVNRGISGQTSAQMLVRFMPDVIALKPRVVHLMCGVNDVAGNTGPTTPKDLLNNIEAMLDLAQAHGVEAILGTLTPVTGLPWAPAVQDPRGRVVVLNNAVRALAVSRGLVLADYFTTLADAGNALKPDLTRTACIRPVGDTASCGRFWTGRCLKAFDQSRSDVEQAPVSPCRQWASCRGVKTVDNDPAGRQHNDRHHHRYAGGA